MRGMKLLSTFRMTRRMAAMSIGAVTFVIILVLAIAILQTEGCVNLKKEKAAPAGVVLPPEDRGTTSEDEPPSLKRFQAELMDLRYRNHLNIAIMQMMLHQAQENDPKEIAEWQRLIDSAFTYLHKRNANREQAINGELWLITHPGHLVPQRENRVKIGQNSNN